MYEEKIILLRDLEEGDKFITKSGTELIYLYPLGNDKHVISKINGSSWEVPNGEFPVFKYKENE
jgi:hypothetical protein